MNPQKQKTQFDSIVEYILKYRFAITLSFGILVLAVVIFTVINYIDSSNNEKANKQYDTAESYINNLQYVTNETERLTIYNQQIQNLDGLILLYPRTVASVRARLFLGRAFYQDFFQSGKTELIEKAAGYFNGAFLAARSDFYKVLAIVGRAQCSEQGNKYDKAFEDYSLVVQNYTNEGFVPMALAGMARCREQMSDTAHALEYYRRLIKEYPDSEWVRFAKGKIYYYTDTSGKNTSNNNTNIPFIIPQP